MRSFHPEVLSCLSTSDDTTTETISPKEFLSESSESHLLLSYDGPNRSLSGEIRLPPNKV